MWAPCPEDAGNVIPPINYPLIWNETAYNASQLPPIGEQHLI